MAREQATSGAVSILQALVWAALACVALLVGVAMVFGVAGSPTPS